VIERVPGNLISPGIKILVPAPAADATGTVIVVDTGMSRR